MFRTGIRCAALYASLSLVACGSPAMVSEECAASADCEEGLSCFTHAGSDTNLCMADCDLTMTRLCEGGLVCTGHDSATRPAELGVCYLGGTTAVGESCTGNLECEAGAICICTAATDAECMTMPETFQHCYRACSVGDDTCETGEVCVGLEGMGDNGFCQPSA